MKASEALTPPVLQLLTALLFFATVQTSFAVDQISLPWKTGEVFIVDNFDFKVTKNDLGFNFFSGNMGEINNPEPGIGQKPIVAARLSADSYGTSGNSWAFSFDFGGYPQEALCGAFLSLFGLTDTLIDLTGTGIQPPGATAFTNYFLNFDNVYGDFLPWAGRSIETVAFDTRLQLASGDVILKIELKDEYGWDVFTRTTNGTTAWHTVTLPRSAFSRSTRGSTAPFRWDRVSLMSIIVERNHVADGVHNPTTGSFLVDNIRLIDNDGLYPDIAAAANPVSGALLDQYRLSFLDHLRKMAFLFFLDFVSTDARTGGVIQDRGTFADLMSLGGVGFQLSAYTIGAERGYIARTAAAARVAAILDVLDSQAQGTNRVGAIGYKGFLYHFVGIDGLRKQNFDFTATSDVDESLNTVELSTIDTALAIMGVITAKQYYQADDPVEKRIRASAERIVNRVEWPFMVAALSNGTHQVCLGWKPVEARDDSQGRFLLPDGRGAGFFSSKQDTNGVEVAATLDYYTDEGLMVALLGMAAPSLSNRVSRAVWDDIIRSGDGFVKTYPGALFTYQFLSCWVDTKAIGPDNHASRPTDFFENSRIAIETTRSYASSNGASTSLGTNAWGLSACEGPFDDYAAEGAPSVALADYTLIPYTAGSHMMEGEAASGDGVTNYNRGDASGTKTRWLTQAGDYIEWTFDAATTTAFNIALRYSNDGPPSDVVAVDIDSRELGRFTTEQTGSGGMGWFTFERAEITNGLSLSAGIHTARVTIVNCDTYGVEIDFLRLDAQGVQRPLETGTLTAYGTASSILHLPDETLAALWNVANLDLNADGHPDLLHPRFGFADAYNIDIADAVSVPGNTNILRTSGPWANMTGFAIDQGPMLLLLDNYLGEQFVPRLFMSDTNVHRALVGVFEGTPLTYTVSYNANGATSGTVPTLQAKTNDVALTLRNNTGNLARTGYAFAGWNTTTNGTGTSYAVGASYTNNAAVTLYAKWQSSSVVAVYRFWSDSLKSHFFTTSAVEKDQIIATWPNVWTYEGIAFYVHGQAVSGSLPVHRFWSDRIGCHLFTISDEEKATLQNRYSKVFAYEGTAWHAFDYHAPGTLPVYRFWAPKLKKPFFTISEAEKANVIATMSATWRYEGIAWYAYTSKSGVVTASMVYHEVEAPAAVTKDSVEPAYLSDARQTGAVSELSGAELQKSVGGPDSDALMALDSDGVYFPLSYTNIYVAASVYDPAAAAWKHVLAPSWDPSGVSIVGRASNRNWLAVLTYDATAEVWGVAHGSWFGRLLKPATEDPGVVLADVLPVGIGLPVEHIVLPETEESLALRLFSDDSIIRTVTGLKGGSTYELGVPAWNQWYRLDIVREQDGKVLESQWIGHMRTH